MPRKIAKIWRYPAQMSSDLCSYLSTDVELKFSSYLSADVDLSFFLASVIGLLNTRRSFGDSVTSTDLFLSN
jgi:hypothetical protein